MLKNKCRKAKGFALIEMLLVVVILAILMGMLMVAFGPAEDRTMATRVKSDLDSLRSAVLAYSSAESWNRNAFSASSDQDAGFLKTASLSPYLTRSIGESFRVIRVDDRLLAGYVNHSKITPSISRRLAKDAVQDGLLTNNGRAYTEGGSIYVYVR